MTSSDTISSTQGQTRFIFNPAIFDEQVKRHCLQVVEQFKQITLNYALFHISFFTIAVFEVLSFLLFFSFFTKSSMLAFSLAAMFLTGFSYFVLLFYLQAKKPEQLGALRNGYIEACKGYLPFERNVPEFHQSLSHALYRLINHLHNQEYTYYYLPEQFVTLAPIMEKFSVWTHWKDLHHMKEMLLFVVIKENIELVKADPSDLEAHAALASAYLSLSKVYRDPRKQDPDRSIPWVSPEYFSPEMQQKFKTAAERAIEEFKILDDFAPNDPWVHAQLATIYHDLGMSSEEIKEYETLLKISPQDSEVSFRLGVLYFQQGFNSKGLRIYEQLKKADDPRTEELIHFYDAYIIQEWSSDII